MALVEDRLATKQDVFMLKQDLAAVESNLRKDLALIETNLKKDIESAKVDNDQMDGGQ
ncbi:MAG: hypothetical protein HQM02_04110 [Magnetococcales bacterium]|nr:hypothetical protein [Magnetococcales bacterium]